MWRSHALQRGRALRGAHRRGREGLLHRHRPHGADGRPRATRAPTTRSSARTAARRSTSTTPATTSGPKSCDLWKPVIAAVNGMACGGAFYMLGEVEFIIAAEHATFFDPHVTYGMTASFEPIHMAGITPFCEIMRHVAHGQLRAADGAARATRSAWSPRSSPATSSSTPPACCADRASPRSPSSRSRARCGRSGARASSAAAHAVRLGYAYVGHGHQPGLDRRGPEALRVGHADRVEGPLSPTSGTRRVAIVGAALSDCGRVDDKTVFELHYQAASRAIADAGLTKADIDGFGSCGTGMHAADRGRRVLRAAAQLGRQHRRSVAARGSSWSSTRPPRSRPGTSRPSCSRTAPRPAPTSSASAGRRTSAFAARGPFQFDVPFGHTLISKYAMATRRHMIEFGTTIDQLAEVAVQHALQRVVQPRGVLPRPDHHRRRAEQPDDRRPVHEAALLHPLRRRRRGRAHVRGAGPRPRQDARSSCSAPARRSRTRR